MIVLEVIVLVLILLVVLLVLHTTRNNALVLAVFVAALSVEEAGSLECADLCPGAQQGSSASTGNNAYCHSSTRPGHPLGCTRGKNRRSLRDKRQASTAKKGGQARMEDAG